MVENFEDITQPLNEDDQRVMVIFLSGINLRTKENPIKAPDIIAAINSKRPGNGIGAKLSGARLRKIVNYIRVNGIAPVMATSEGYFVSDDPVMIRSQIRSLSDRAEGIQAAATGLSNYLTEMLERQKKERESIPAPSLFG